MRDLLVVALVLAAVLTFAEMLDPSFGSLRISGEGLAALGWNPAGLMGFEGGCFYTSVTYRTNGVSDAKSFRISWVEREGEPPMVGALSILREFHGSNFDRIQLVYDLAGENGSTYWGMGLGLERVVDEANPSGYYSVVIDLGVLGKTETFEYAVALRRFRLWSGRADDLLSGDFGVALGVDLKALKLSAGIMSYNAEYFRPYLGIDLETGPIGLGLGAEMVVLRDLRYFTRVEGSFYLNTSPFSMGVYGAYSFGGVDGVETSLNTVVSIFAKYEM